MPIGKSDGIIFVTANPSITTGIAVLFLTSISFFSSFASRDVLAKTHLAIFANESPSPTPIFHTPVPGTPKPTPTAKPNCEYSTYFGGSSWDGGIAISVDSNYCPYLAGDTYSLIFPTKNPYQPSYAGGDRDIFIAKFRSSGSDIIYSTYLGGMDSDCTGGMISDIQECVYIFGNTSSGDFPTENPYSTQGNQYVAKLSSSGSSIIYSTMLTVGSLSAIAVDSFGCAYLTGDTSENFPTLNPYQGTFGGGIRDAFTMKLASSGSSLIYSTYLGGLSEDSAESIVIDSEQQAYICGTTTSQNYPTTNAYQSSYAGLYDGFITVLASSGSLLIYSTYLGGREGYDSCWHIIVDSTQNAYISGVTGSVDFPTYNAYRASYDTGDPTDGYIACIKPTGSKLTYSSYFNIVKPLGVSSAQEYYVYRSDCVYAISSLGESLAYYGRWDYTGYPALQNACIDNLGYIYDTGSIAEGSTLYVKNAYQPVCGGGSTDAYLVKIYLFPTETETVLESSDYDGDGTSDIAIFRGTEGLWSVRDLTRIYFGSSSDLPACGDYDGDGTSDITAFRPASALWAARNVTRVYFGSSSDFLIPGDYDGNGTCDIGVFRPSSGLWSIRNVTRVYLGAAIDIPVPGDFSGDGRTDMGVFRGSSGLWAIRDITRIYFGASSDHLVHGDYDGNGTWEAGIFRPSSSLWSIRNLTRAYFGGASDSPVHADFDGDKEDEMGIFRDSSGLWSVKDLTRFYFGAAGDIPVSR